MKLKPADHVASNILGFPQIKFYREQLKKYPLKGSKVIYLQYRNLIRPSVYDNNINLKMLESELIKILVGF
jgi:hypothetical protein